MKFEIWKVNHWSSVYDYYTLIIDNNVIQRVDQNSNVHDPLVVFPSLYFIKPKNGWAHNNHSAIVSYLPGFDMTPWDLEQCFKDTEYKIGNRNKDTFGWDFTECIFSTTDVNDIHKLHDHLPEYYY